MENINVELDDYTQPRIALKALGKPYRNKKPTMELLAEIAKSGHTSILEHVVFHFDITGVSRLLLQEFSRHRIASETVESTRYCLVKSVKELDTESSGVYVYFVIPEFFRCRPELEMMYRRQIGYCINGIREMNEYLMELKRNGDDLLGERPTDYLKYMLIEGFRTNIYWSINLRSLLNFIKLRNSRNAHFEIRCLARYIKDLVRETPYCKIIDIMNEIP